MLVTLLRVWCGWHHVGDMVLVPTTPVMVLTTQRADTAQGTTVVTWEVVKAAAVGGEAAPGAVSSTAQQMLELLTHGHAPPSIGDSQVLRGHRAQSLQGHTATGMGGTQTVMAVRCGAMVAPCGVGTRTAVGTPGVWWHSCGRLTSLGTFGVWITSPNPAHPSLFPPAPASHQWPSYVTRFPGLGHLCYVIPMCHNTHSKPGPITALECPMSSCSHPYPHVTAPHPCVTSPCPHVISQCPHVTKQYPHVTTLCPHVTAWRLCRCLMSSCPAPCPSVTA